MANDTVSPVEPDPAPPRSCRRLRWAVKLAGVRRAEEKADYRLALERLDSAAAIKPLWPEHRVWRAWLLLREQRLEESQNAFAALRKEFQGSENPDLKYLRHFCTAMLGMLRIDAAPMAFAARQAADIPCRPSLRRNFPLVGAEDEEER
jgi:hypothetical protein